MPKRKWRWWWTRDTNALDILWFDIAIPQLHGGEWRNSVHSSIAAESLVFIWPHGKKRPVPVKPGECVEVHVISDDDWRAAKALGIIKGD